MNRLIISILILSLIIVISFLVVMWYRRQKPGLKRIKKYHSNHSLKAKTTALKESKVSIFIRVIPETYINRLKQLVYQSGQHHNGLTVDLFIRQVTKLFLVSLVVSVILFLLIFNGNDLNTFERIRLLILPFLPFVAVFLSCYQLIQKKKGLTKQFVYHSSEILSVLEDELVYGSGDVSIAFEKVSKEVPYEFKEYFKDINKQINHDKGGYHNALKMLENTIDHSLVKSLVLGLKIGGETGRLKRTFETLHLDAKQAVGELIKQSTQRINFYMSITGIGIVIMFGLLFGIPVLVNVFEGINITF